MLEGSKIIVMPSSNDPASSGGGVKTGEKDAGTANAKSSNLNEKLINNIPPPKTDKPRPHRCATCLRGFARLEHLKRHERSHTKEKPFECDQCSRCFARRDLLLRHQQKLHELVMPSSRARNRRESTTNPSPANAPGRVRKNSLANSRGAAVTMRPRANTISHVEGSHTQLVESVAPTAAVRPGLLPTHNRHASLAEPAIQRTELHSCSGLSSNMGQRAINHSLPRIDTNNFHGVEYGMGLRTAPLMGRHGPDFYFETLMFRPNSTINPNALHYNDSLHSMTYETTAQYNTSMATDMNTPRCDENIEWMNSFESGLSFHDQSSPAAISASSPSRISDIMLDGSNHPAQSTLMWPPTMLAPRRRSLNLFSSEHGNNGPHDILNHGQSPSPLHTQPSESDSFFSTPPLCPRSCAQNNFEGLELS